MELSLHQMGTTAEVKLCPQAHLPACTLIAYVIPNLSLPCLSSSWLYLPLLCSCILGTLSAGTAATT